MSMAAEPAKLRRYNPSMSRRTRRPAPSTDAKEEDDELQKESYGFQRMSLKELIKVSNLHKINGISVRELMETDGDRDIIKNMPSRAWRAAAAAEPEKSLAMVTKQTESAGIVCRCLKALSRLIKAKSSSKQRTNSRFLVQ